MVGGYSDINNSFIPRGIYVPWWISLGLLEVPLKRLHEELGARFGEFAGWSVPMAYGSVVDEHMAVRRGVGVFDVSHMGRILVEGPGAQETLDYLVAKKVSKLKPGRAIMPTAMLNEEAGFVDDVTVYMLGEERFLVVCNAVNRGKVVEWIKSHEQGRVDVEDITERTVMLAVQGPGSRGALEGVAGIDGLRPGVFYTGHEVFGFRVLMVGGGGWTGEVGYELIAEPGEARGIYEELLRRGVKPVGIASRDTLRIEAGYVLYGHEIDESTTPLEARYWVFSYKKKGYIGYEALKRQLLEGVGRVRVGLLLGAPGPIPRGGSKIYLEGREVGVVTSGAWSPVLRAPIAMGYVKAGHALMGLKVSVEVRGRLYPARIVDFPFVTPSSSW